MIFQLKISPDKKDESVSEDLESVRAEENFYKLQLVKYDKLTEADILSSLELDKQLLYITLTILGLQLSSPPLIEENPIGPYIFLSSIALGFINIILILSAFSFNKKVISKEVTALQETLKNIEPDYSHADRLAKIAKRIDFSIWCIFVLFIFLSISSRIITLEYLKSYLTI